MSVHLHRCERTDGLVRTLAQVLRTAPADPFTPDVVAVPTRGIERFLAQELSQGLGAQPGRSDGVCANVQFPSPAELVQRVLQTEGPPAVHPEADPWRPERLVWPLLAVIDESAAEPWCAPVARHLGLADAPAAWHLDLAASSETRLDRRFAVATRLASLFEGYSAQRPSLLLEWASGSDTDGSGSPLPDDLRWQPELWRRLRVAIGTPSHAERLDAACHALVADPSRVDLPQRLSVFGPSRLTADQLAVLAALGAHRDVHLWLADASPTLWTRLADSAPLVADASPVPPGGRTRRAPLPPRRRDDRTAASVANPLLRSLGRDARELRVRLGDLIPEADVHIPLEVPAGTLLARVQRDLRDDHNPAARAPLVLDGDDRSIQVHACHGATRQAEVLREVVLGLLEADRSLEPRDILVMCPDLATMAPLISAAFSDARPGAAVADLRLRIADRTPEQANDVLAALDALLALVPGRFLLSEVLDLIARPPVRTRYGLSDDDVERIEELAVDAGVRWGLDEDTRAAYQLAGLTTGTWQWGLDRMLLGAALSEDGLPLCHGVLPLDDVPSADVALVGRLAEIVARLRAFRDGCAGLHPLGHWTGLLESAVTGLMDARGPEAWQVPHALAVIAALDQSAEGYAAAVPLSLADLRWMLAEVLAGRPTRTNFRSGGLTVCGLAPMRSVPHRVICLVGMDDGVFPRSAIGDGDDVLARDPRLGERDPRSEDRQILLDAIMAATDTLVITYTGADDRTNESRPPCVPLGELLDTLDSTARTDDGRPARARAVTHHPLQPFDPRNFLPDALGVTTAFSHDTEALAGAEAARGPRVKRPALIGSPLTAGTPWEPSPAEPLPPPAEPTLVELARFLRAPAADYLRGSLGLSIDSGADELDETIPLELDGLAAWGIGERTIAQLAQGRDPGRIVAAERARGVVPPGGLGAPGLHEVGHAAQEIAARLASARVGDPRLVSIRLDLPSGRRLTGAVADVHDDCVVRATYSKPRARSLVALWPELLALAVMEPATRWSATLVCRGGTVRLSAPEADTAAATLDALLDLYVAGRSEPLPMPPATSMAFAEARLRPYRTATALRAAGREWFAERFDRDTGERRTWGEATEAAHVLVYGSEAPLDVLLADGPRASEQWAPDEGSRFAALALRVWAPILAAREVIR